MLVHRRTHLAALRLGLLFVLILALLSVVGQTVARYRDDRAGLGGPYPPQVNHPFLGIHVDLQQYTVAQQRRVAQRLAATGFEWARIRLAWDWLEPQPGQWAWRQADTMVAALLDAGLTPVLLLDGSPAWARADVDLSGPHAALAPPADPADFAAFAAAIATRYGDRVRYYQVWNEPNIAPHWGMRHIEPIAYAQLLKAAATAIRGADPDAFILTAALAPTTDRGHTAIDEATYLRRLYAAGSAASFDAVAVQPFGFGATPDDGAQLARRLTWQRMRLVRQVMLDAGDGATPIWVARMGWNVRADSAWATVTPASQVAYTLAALDMAYTRLPWVVAVGWAVDQPAAPLGDPIWGFALTDGLAEALRGRQAGQGPRPAPVTTPPPLPGWLLAGPLLLGVLIWRSVRAARLIAWHDLRRAYLAWAWPWQVGVWALLLGVYYLATWPPLIVACWVMAALLIAARPRDGLMLVLALLPFHSIHKEILWAGSLWSVPPAQAALFCLLPSVLVARAGLLRRDGWSLAAATWIGVALVAAPGVRAWPAYLQSLLDLTLVPVALFFLVRRHAQTVTGRREVAIGLAVGGVLAAVVGLVEWSSGGGTLADGMRRLVGPTFSPNHTALYLERTLFLLAGLLATSRGRARMGWIMTATMTGIALLLTGSRGALLLGLPAGMAIWLLWSRPAHTLGLWLRRAGLPVVLLVLLVAAGLGERLLNTATLGARWETWQAAWRLALDFPIAGVGPGGFYWSYPAYLPPGYPTEPNLRHPHQLWLELATSGGAAALLWFAGVTTLAVRQARRLDLRRADAALSIGAVAGLAAGLAHGQVDAFQALPDLAAWNWCALALLAAGQIEAAARQDSGSQVEG